MRPESKVLHVLFLCAETYPPPYLFLDRVFNRALRDSGYEVAWVMPESGTDKIEIRNWNGHRVWTIPRTTTESSLLWGYRRHHQMVSKAVGMAAEALGQVDLVQVRDDPAMGFVGRRFARARRVPFVYQLSHLKEEESLLWGVRGYYGGRPKNLIKGTVGLAAREVSLLGADLVFPISDHMSQQLRRYAVPGRRMVTLPEGVDTVQFVPCDAAERRRLRDQLGLGTDPIALYVGTLGRLRQLDELVHAMALLSRRGESVRLVVVGDSVRPGELQNLKDLSRGLGVDDRITFTGHLQTQSVVGYMQAADLGVSAVPNNLVYRSSSPIKPLEYMAAGLPVVATNIPPHRTLTQGAGVGLLVQHDRFGFARGIGELLQRSPDQRVQLGAKGRLYVQEHREFRVLAGRVVEEYERLLARRT